MSLSRKSPTNTPQESGIASQNKIADDIAKSKSDAASLKRGRAESVEPSQPLDAVSSTIPKKNRLAPTTGQQPAKPLDPEQSPNIDYDEPSTEIAPDTADDAKTAQPVDAASEDKANPRMVSITEEKGETPVSESNNVGEVRRKVAKMSYDELRKGAKNSEAGSAAGLDIEEGDVADSIMSASTELDGPEAGSVAMSNGADGSADHSTSEGLKRKALDRSESSFIKEEEVAQAKRLKDVPLPAGDAKPAAESTEATVPPAKKPQASFSAFSSAASPFATARSSSPFASASGSASATNAFGASAGSSSASKSSPFATSGFGNYSKTSSPFAKKPADTPSTAATDEKEAVVSEDKSAKAGPSTFGDILKTESKDVESEDAKVQMTEQDVHTGEEDEATAYQTRAKLYVMQADGGWRERGVGTLKLNVRRSDGKGPRIVMRAEGVLRLILNVSLYVGMSCLEDGKHVRLTVFENGERRFVTLRTGSNKAASELSGHIHEHIPLESSVPPKSPSPSAGDSRNGANEEV